MAPQGVAAVLPPKQTSFLQNRNDEVDDIIEPSGEMGRHHDKSVCRTFL